MPGRPVVPVMGGGLPRVNKSLTQAVNRHDHRLASPMRGRRSDPAGFAQATRKAAPIAGRGLSIRLTCLSGWRDEPPQPKGAAY